MSATTRLSLLKRPQPHLSSIAQASTRACMSATTLHFRPLLSATALDQPAHVRSHSSSLAALPSGLMDASRHLLPGSGDVSVPFQSACGAVSRPLPASGCPSSGCPRPQWLSIRRPMSATTPDLPGFLHRLPFVVCTLMSATALHPRNPARPNESANFQCLLGGRGGPAR